MANYCVALLNRISFNLEMLRAINFNFVPFSLVKVSMFGAGSLDRLSYGHQQLPLANELATQLLMSLGSAKCLLDWRDLSTLNLKVDFIVEGNLIIGLNNFKVKFHESFCIFLPSSINETNRKKYLQLTEHLLQTFTVE